MLRNHARIHQPAESTMILQCTFGAQRLSIYTTRCEWPKIRMDQIGRGIKSVLPCSSYFVGILNMYKYTCIQNKNCHQHSYGFQNLMSSWGLGNTIFEIRCQVGDGGTKFQNYNRYVTFLFLVPNLSFFTHDLKKK